jgi:predicted N-acyltransferase
MKTAKYSIKIHHSISEISRAEWNGLITPGDLPFMEWEWLSAMEKSGSICPETSWHPLHLSLWEGNALKAAAPFYLKTSSDGEYVWDYFWVEAASSLKTGWYPKLVGCIPATPAEGYHFLHAPDIDTGAVTSTFLNAAESLCRNNGVESLNLHFVDPRWAKSLNRSGFMAWEHSSYLWENPGYRDFEDYLSIFNKNQRKNIRKEYRHHEEQGISINVVDGKDAAEEHFRTMFDLFTLTNDKFYPWDARWVNEQFFMQLEQQFRSRLAVVEARKDGRIIAMAFMVRKDDRIWGRYWGAYETIRDLHFAVCYYAPMDWCIKEGIRYFDPGAGSPHKIRRGFKAVTNYSYHKFFNPTLEKLFRNNIGMVNVYERGNIANLNAELPFKADNKKTAGN